MVNFSGDGDCNVGENSGYRKVASFLWQRDGYKTDKESFGSYSIMRGTSYQ